MSVKEALLAERESKEIEFKRSFDTSSKGGWCEVIKDIIAMANSGGGILIFGLNNDGTPSGEDVQNVLDLDNAIITDKISKYTGQQFSDIEINEEYKMQQRIAIMTISGSDIPIVFSRSGTYRDDSEKEKSAFAQGTVYFRHGAKSEPCNTDDLREVIENKIKIEREEFMKNLNQIVSAPIGSKIEIRSGDIKESKSPEATQIRLTNDPSAPTYKIVNYDESYPYRQRELIKFVNQMLPKGVNINQHDIQCIRRIYEIDTKPKFFHKPKYSSPQYSDEFADFVVNMYRQNNNFFLECRNKLRDS